MVIATRIMYDRFVHSKRVGKGEDAPIAPRPDCGCQNRKGIIYDHIKDIERYEYQLMNYFLMNVNTIDILTY